MRVRYVRTAFQLVMAIRFPLQVFRRCGRRNSSTAGPIDLLAKLRHRLELILNPRVLLTMPLRVYFARNCCALNFTDYFETIGEKALALHWIRTFHGTATTVVLNQFAVKVANGLPGTEDAALESSWGRLWF
jgi:hypothetical protein